ncbi:MAG: type II toxin-antitoxin system VapC family toxin [Candidatus Kapabacteria bacterium]|nr:type II toxin-antitoxin system VapC family toxin [Candidatus Kapabacteria bacterium]
MNKQKVYIETSVISYLTSRPSRDIIVSSHQQITNQWWKKSKSKFNNYISEFVIDEISKGDKSASEIRLASVKNIQLLEYDDDIVEIAINYANLLSIPEKARLDAFHLAISVYYEIDFLLSWNCKHIANAVVMSKLRDYNKTKNLFTPILCTPLELLEV